ncbi:MAG: ABC transporter substrate-binding protein, partial [Dehalococcoidia bacterium]|nr:ABC transporter substrate-binding protein [Dehalococcoidia bacterium]
MMHRPRLAGLALAVMMAGSLVLASCATTPSTPAPSSASTADTKPYGSLTIAGGSGGGRLDPQGDNVSFNNLGGIIFDSLVYYGPDSKKRPGIAERWEISPDGRTHTFYIRKGVKFHNGDDLTGADVKFSLEKMLEPVTLQTDAPAWRAVVASVVLVDDYTVAVNLKSPQWDLIDGAGFEAMVSVMPKKYIERNGEEAWRKTPIGSGPFKVV